MWLYQEVIEHYLKSTALNTVTKNLLQSLKTNSLQEVYKSIHQDMHYVKSVRIWSFSGPYFAAFELNTK